MPAPDTSGDDPALFQIIARLSEHVSRLSETLCATEDFMTEHFHDILAVRPHAMEDFQRLDFLNQSLVDTSRLLKNLSDGCLEQTSLLRDIQLETTQKLVLEHRQKSQAVVDDGDVQFF